MKQRGDPGGSAAPAATARGGGIVRDTSIRAYRAKRDFTRTAEPAPAPAIGGEGAPMFVVQKHNARRAGLHWDFRLEHGGVLWSWAVRKGPSLDPADRRLAAHVEDHPLDYADFQGSIPEGQYGAGEVATWDRGTWEPIGDPEAAMRKGDLQFVLHGTRLNGRFHLVRLNRRERSRQDAWFLIKGHDEHERPGIDALALEDEVPPPAPPAKETGGRAKRPPAGAVRGALPREQAPELASIAEAPPEGEGWVSEIKFDGYRLLARIDHGEVRLLTRNGHDWADRLPAVAKAVAALGVRTALLDGELVALRESGASSFPDLQAALSDGNDSQLTFFLFDLLHLNGWDLRPCALRDRKQALAALADWRGMLRYSDHVEGHTAELRRRACGMGLEGILCKRADAPYRPGRGKDWLKVKCQGREELIVLGWTLPGGSRTGLGSLQLGYHDEAGRLHYAGGVGTGFTERELTELRGRLDALAAEPPQSCWSAASRWSRGSTGCAPSWSPRSSSPPGRARAGCAIRCISGCARTRAPRRSCSPCPTRRPSAAWSSRAPRRAASRSRGVGRRSRCRRCIARSRLGRTPARRTRAHPW